MESVFEVSEYDRYAKVMLKGIGQPYRNSNELYVCGNDRTGLDYSYELLELDMFMRPFEKLICMEIEEDAEHTRRYYKKFPYFPALKLWDKK